MGTGPQGGQGMATLTPEAQAVFGAKYANPDEVWLGGFFTPTEASQAAARAEGVNYVNLCVSNNVGDDIRDAELITGKPHAASTDRHLLVFGEEMSPVMWMRRP